MRFLAALLCAAALTLSGCATLSPTNPESNAASELLLRGQLARVEAPPADAAPRIFYLGFAGHSESTAFVGDLELAERVLRQRDSDLIAIELANPRGGELKRPFATQENLARAVDAIAGAARPQDLVVILLSSHGNVGMLALHAGRDNLPSLSDRRLQTILTKLNGKPTVMVISACFSGSLIPALRNDSRIILTAAAANRSSFGCQTTSRNTYFVEELLANRFNPSESLEQAFRRASEQVLAREKRMGLTPPSNPQIFVGKGMNKFAATPIQDWLRPGVAPTP